MAVLKIRRGRLRPDQYRLALRPSVVELLVRHVGRHVWGWRREAATLVAVLLVYRRCVALVGPTGGRWLFLAVLVVVAVVPVTRRVVLGWLLGGRLRRRWAAACRACRLETPGRIVGRTPRIRRARRGPAGWHLRITLTPGQSVEELHSAAARLTATLKLRELRISPDLDRADRVGLVLVRREVLGRPIRADLLPAGDPGDLDRLPVGAKEDGTAWLLPLRGSHVLVAGATGAGKGSVLWSIVRALAPAIRAGLVEVWAVDPKGGMELAFGEPLFHRFAVDVDSINDLLADAVREMNRRTGRLRGVSRLHKPSLGDPLVVVLVDEIASLTAYVSDPERKKQIGANLSLLLSQGRAPGVVVVGAVQDPRKEVLPIRDLFPVRVALRMTEKGQADMVLGGGAHDRGAVCERIPRGLPGVGYVLVDGDPTPVRVRAGWLTDDDIRAMATHHRPPTTPPAPPSSAGPPPAPRAPGWTPTLPPAPAAPPARPPTHGPRSAASERYRDGDGDGPTIPLRGWPLPPPPVPRPIPLPPALDDGSPAAEAAWRAWETHLRRR
ncbi:FtsK/SpoIIIE domain-containing protein [Frankia sp. AiPs1]|uniref:FtsK/SpoIIIE domain-containing protein n=1 Tax=Frankia sp. AiPs1 TaxID=573493 RepID=UPI002044AE94|nr:FtsK/SpoIIIE domain-containing protein [Frankia sp. AiPs1]MCM3922248.1 FtsK/SpoIIIE domain-containing protein [Frankia sp. AiPs1]